ncbi:hypothetical protein [Acinetobacter modestus]|uniref:hypothetical protein n=1 Tax=Acinetobacter modestus TaxID=1776740 RepID=UPI003018BCD3
MPSQILEYFAYQHLPEKLQAISKPMAELAEKMDAELPDGAEKSAGLRKLLEAKDCFVRQALSKNNAPAKPQIKPSYSFGHDEAKNVFLCRILNVDQLVVGEGRTEQDAALDARQKLRDLGWEVI